MDLDRLSLRDLRVLKYIRLNPGAILTYMSKELRIPPSSLHSTLTKLQLMGFITKKNGGYFITDKGIEAMNVIASMVSVE